MGIFLKHWYKAKLSEGEKWQHRVFEDLSINAKKNFKEKI